MLDKLKELWAKWNVQVKVVGGVLVVATIWGTCSYEPNLNQASEGEAVEAVPTSNTTTQPTTEEAVNSDNATGSEEGSNSTEETNQ